MDKIGKALAILCLIALPLSMQSQDRRAGNPQRDLRRTQHAVIRTGATAHDAQSRLERAQRTAALATLDNIHIVSVTPDGHELWAYGSHSRVIAVVDLTSGADNVVSSIELPGDNRAPVSHIVFSRDGEYAYLANTAQYSMDRPGYAGNPQAIVIIDAVKKRIEAQISIPSPWLPMYSLAISPDGLTLYSVVVDFSNGREAICITDVRTHEIRGFHDLPGVNRLTMSPDGRYLYCARGSNFIGPSPDLLSVVQLPSMQLLYSVTTGKRPYSVAVTADGTTAVVTDAGDADVMLIDLVTRTTRAKINLEMVPSEIAITPDGTKAFIGTVGTSGNYAIGAVVVAVDIERKNLKGYIYVSVEPACVSMDPAGRRVYVSDGNANGLQPASAHVLDAINDVYLRPIILRRAARYTPTGIDVTPDGGRAFILAKGRGSLLVVDLAARKVVAEMFIRPRAVTVSRDGKRVFLLCPHYQAQGDGRLVILDVKTLHVLDDIELGNIQTAERWDSVVDRIVLDYNETTAYLTCGDQLQILFVDFAGHRVSARIPVTATGNNVPARGLALTPDGRRLFASDTMSQSVAVIDTALRSVISMVPVGNSPTAIHISQDGQRVYVLQQHSTEMMTIFDAESLSLIRKIYYPPMVAAELNFFISEDENLVWIPCFDPNWVMLFSLDPSGPMAIQTLLKTGLDPFNMTVSADRKHIFVTNFTSDTVSVIDALTRQISYDIHLNSHATR
jgi:YVTN family beta-propeller protein